MNKKFLIILILTIVVLSTSVLAKPARPSVKCQNNSDCTPILFELNLPADLKVSTPDCYYQGFCSDGLCAYNDTCSCPDYDLDNETVIMILIAQKRVASIIIKSLVLMNSN